LTETHGKGFLNNDFSVFLFVFRVFRVHKNTHPGDSQRPGKDRKNKVKEQKSGQGKKETGKLDTET
jgi:hypothetical protein